MCLIEYLAQDVGISYLAGCLEASGVVSSGCRQGRWHVLVARYNRAEQMLSNIYFNLLKAQFITCSYVTCALNERSPFNF